MKIYPKLGAILDMNVQGTHFNNYQVLWDEERNDIDLHHTLRTNYDFEEVNRAYQKAIRQEKESNANAAGGEFDDDDNDNNDEWGQESST